MDRRQEEHQHHSKPYLHSGVPRARAILHSPPGALSLVACAVLLLRLGHQLKLNTAIRGPGRELGCEGRGAVWDTRPHHLAAQSTCLGCPVHTQKGRVWSTIGPPERSKGCLWSFILNMVWKLIKILYIKNIIHTHTPQVLVA